MFPFVMWSTKPFQNKHAFPPIEERYVAASGVTGPGVGSAPLHSSCVHLNNFKLFFLFKQGSNSVSLLYITASSVSIFFLQRCLPEYFC